MDVFSSCVIDSSPVKVIALRAFAWPLLASLYISSALKAGTEIGGRETCILSQWPFPMALSINNNENPPNRLPPAPSTVASKQFSFTKQIERERDLWGNKRNRPITPGMDTVSVTTASPVKVLNVNTAVLPAGVPLISHCVSTVVLSSMLLIEVKCDSCNRQTHTLLRTY